MGILKIFGQALTTSVRKARLLAILWPVYLLFSLFVVAPFYFLLQAISPGHSGREPLTGFDMLWIGDLFINTRRFRRLFSAGFLGTPFFSSCWRHSQRRPHRPDRAGKERVTIASFFGDCGRYFGRFFRVLLLSLIGYFLVLGVLGRLVSIPFRIWNEAASSQWTTLIASSLRLLVLLLLFSVVKMFFDYVKVALVVDDSRRTVRTTLRTFGFIGRRFFKAWGLFLIVGLILVVSTLVYLAGAKILPKTGLGPVLFSGSSHISLSSSGRVSSSWPRNSIF
jgi:hypothetical protein